MIKDMGLSKVEVTTYPGANELFHAFLNLFCCLLRAMCLMMPAPFRSGRMGKGQVPLAVFAVYPRHSCRPFVA